MPYSTAKNFIKTSSTPNNIKPLSPTYQTQTIIDNHEIQRSIKGDPICSKI